MPCVNGSRIVVITQGPRETILAGKRLGIVKYKVLPIDQKLVIDTTGAGDAFCGGFISSLLDSTKLKTRNESHILLRSQTPDREDLRVCGTTTERGRSPLTTYIKYESDDLKTLPGRGLCAVL